MGLILSKCGPVPGSAQCFKGNEILQRLKTKSKTFSLKFLISLTLIYHNPIPLPFQRWTQKRVAHNCLAITLSKYANVKKGSLKSINSFPGSTWQLFETYHLPETCQSLRNQGCLCLSRAPSFHRSSSFLLFFQRLFPPLPSCFLLAVLLIRPFFKQNEESLLPGKWVVFCNK